MNTTRNMKKKRLLRKMVAIVFLSILLLFLTSCKSITSNSLNDASYTLRVLDETKEETLSKLNTYTIKEETISSERVEATLDHVVDGDTLWVYVESERIKIRLIGVDTPESVHADEDKNNVWGEMASTHTKEITNNIETIYLEYDVEKVDSYDRHLAYVWFTKDSSDVKDMLNATILRDGYAKDKVYKPNTKYADVFKTLCDTAREQRCGLWKEEEFIALWE